MLYRVLISTLLVMSLTTCRHFPDAKQTNAATEAADSAKSLIASGDYREALRELLRGQELNPNSSEVHYLLATVYLIGFTRLEDAKLNALAALKLSKGPYPEAENLTGAIFLELNQPNTALEYLQRAANNLLYDTPYFAEQNLGRAFAELKKAQESVNHYAKAVSLQPMLCGAYVPYSEQLISLSQFQKAEENLLQFYKRCDSNDSEAQETMKKVRAHLVK